MSLEIKDLGDLDNRSVIIGKEARGNYTEFETTGFAAAYGKAVAYRDEYPVELIAAGGAASPGLTNVTIGGVQRRMWAFDGVNTEERLSGSIEIPHDYAYGLPIEIHCHFRPSTALAGDVEWHFDWEYSVAFGAPAAQDSFSAIYSIPADSQHHHLLLDLASPLPDLGYGLGDKIGFNIRRTPAGVNDTYAGDVFLEQVAAHIPVDSNGSRQLYSK